MNVIALRQNVDIVWMRVRNIIMIYWNLNGDAAGSFGGGGAGG